MSDIVAEQYRGFAINFLSPDEPDDNDLIEYASPQSKLRNKAMSGLPIPPASTLPSFGTQPQAVLPYPAPHTNGHHEPQSTYVAAHHMLPQQLPPHYGYEPPSSSRSRKRARSGSGNDSRRRVNPDFEIQQPLLADGSASAPEPPEIIYPVHSEHSSSHPSSAHGFPSPISLPVPQQHHHHHRLPSQARLRSAHGSASSPVPGSVVGLPGMPMPAPRPPAPKSRFTTNDDVLLADLKEHRNLTWKQIGEFFPGRKMGTLQVRYCTKLKVKNLVWTDEMVARLRRAMDNYEKDRWRIIAQKVGHGFTPAACRERAARFGE